MKTKDVPVLADMSHSDRVIELIRVRGLFNELRELRGWQMALSLPAAWKHPIKTQRKHDRCAEVQRHLNRWWMRNAHALLDLGEVGASCLAEEAKGGGA